MASLLYALCACFSSRPSASSGSRFLREIFPRFFRAVTRERKPDFWVDFTLNLLSMMGDEWDFVIIPDCRHANELSLERYGFQPKHLRVEGRGAPLSPAAADFTIQSDTPYLRAEVAKIARGLLDD